MSASTTMKNANWIQPEAFISILEFFRANHRDEEIGKKQQRDDAGDDGFHMQLKFVAEAHVKGAHHEEQDNRCGEDQVSHNCYLFGKLQTCSHPQTSHFSPFAVRSRYGRPTTVALAKAGIKPVHDRD